MPEFLFCSVVLNLVEASLLEVILLVLVGYHSHHAARISHSHHIVGDILRHDAAGAYDYVVADMHSGIYHAIRAYPHVIADCHLDTVLISGVAWLPVNRMTGGGYGSVCRNHDVVADFDLRHVYYREVIACEEVLADFDILTVVAVNRRENFDVLSNLAEKLTEKLLLSFRVLRRAGVECGKTVLALYSLLGEPVLPRLIRKSREHSLFFCHTKNPFVKIKNEHERKPIAFV